MQKCQSKRWVRPCTTEANSKTLVARLAARPGAQRDGLQSGFLFIPTLREKLLNFKTNVIKKKLPVCFLSDGAKTEPASWGWVSSSPTCSCHNSPGAAQSTRAAHRAAASLLLPLLRDEFYLSCRRGEEGCQPVSLLYHFHENWRQLELLYFYQIWLKEVTGLKVIKRNRRYNDKPSPPQKAGLKFMY